MDGQSRASLRPAQEFLSEVPASQTIKRGTRGEGSSIP